MQKEEAWRRWSDNWFPYHLILIVSKNCLANGCFSPFWYILKVVETATLEKVRWSKKRMKGLSGRFQMNFARFGSKFFAISPTLFSAPSALNKYNAPWLLFSLAKDYLVQPSKYHRKRERISQQEVFVLKRFWQRRSDVVEYLWEHFEVRIILEYINCYAKFWFNITPLTVPRTKTTWPWVSLIIPQLHKLIT